MKSATEHTTSSINRLCVYIHFMDTGSITCSCDPYTTPTLAAHNGMDNLDSMYSAGRGTYTCAASFPADRCALCRCTPRRETCVAVSVAGFPSSQPVPWRISSAGPWCTHGFFPVRFRPIDLVPSTPRALLGGVRVAGLGSAITSRTCLCRSRCA